jgi:hypothetical protein
MPKQLHITNLPCPKGEEFHLFNKETSLDLATNLTVLVLFVVLLSFSELNSPLSAQTNQIPVTVSNSLPSSIITTDGQIYKNVKLLRVVPDGLLVEYLLDSGWTGVARLKFTKLSKSLQKQFGYDPQKASAYEKDQALAMTELSQKLEQDEKTRTTMLGELSRSLVYVKSAQPVVTYVYYDPTGPTPSQLGKEWKGMKKKLACIEIPRFQLQQLRFHLPHFSAGGQ